MNIIDYLGIIQIHESVIYPYELQGLAKDKSLQSIVQRVFNRLDYGLIEDIFDLASCYCEVIAKGYAFNDANKRTAFETMNMILLINDISLEYKYEEMGNLILDLVNDKINHQFLAQYLKQQYYLQNNT